MARLAPIALGMCTAAGMCVPAAGQPATFSGLGELSYTVYSNAVSADGAAIAVIVWNFGEYHAFRWTRSGGLMDCGSLQGGWDSFGYGISGDGLVVVGSSGPPFNPPLPMERHACRCAPGGSMTSLGLPGSYSESLGANADGSVLVGYKGTPAQAFRWASGAGPQNLGTLVGDSYSVAYAVCADGSVVVGISGGSQGDHDHAFRWTSAGMASLGALPGGTFSQAYATNSSGTIVVGLSTGSFVGAHAFKWTQGVGMEDIDTLAPGWSSYATAVNSSGSIVAGHSRYTIGTVNYIAPFVWRTGVGMANLNAYLPTVGVNLTGWTLDYLGGMSADGLVIAGSGTHEVAPGYSRREAWIATLPGAAPCYPNCDASNAAPILNVNDFVCFNTAYAAGSSYANCDGSTLAPTLNVADFVCFMNRYAAGCP